MYCVEGNIMPGPTISYIGGVFSALASSITFWCFSDTGLLLLCWSMMAWLTEAYLDEVRAGVHIVLRVGVQDALRFDEFLQRVFVVCVDALEVRDDVAQLSFAVQVLVGLVLQLHVVVRATVLVLKRTHVVNVLLLPKGRPTVVRISWSPCAKMHFCPNLHPPG